MSRATRKLEEQDFQRDYERSWHLMVELREELATVAEPGRPARVGDRGDMRWAALSIGNHLMASTSPPPTIYAWPR